MNSNKKPKFLKNQSILNLLRSSPGMAALSQGTGSFLKRKQININIRRYHIYLKSSDLKVSN